MPVGQLDEYYIVWLIFCSLLGVLVSVLIEGQESYIQAFASLTAFVHLAGCEGTCNRCMGLTQFHVDEGLRLYQPSIVNQDDLRQTAPVN